MSFWKIIINSHSKWQFISFAAFQPISPPSNTMAGRKKKKSPLNTEKWPFFQEHISAKKYNFRLNKTIPTINNKLFEIFDFFGKIKIKISVSGLKTKEFCSQNTNKNKVLFIGRDKKQFSQLNYSPLKKNTTHRPPQNRGKNIPEWPKTSLFLYPSRNYLLRSPHLSPC